MNNEEDSTTRDQETAASASREPQGFHVATIDASEASWWRRLGAGATHYPFVHRARYYFVLSFLVIVAGLGALSARGLNFGISFKGGVSWQVPSATLTVRQASKIVASAGVTQATVVTLGAHGSRTVEVQAGLSKLSGAARTAKENQVASLLASKAHIPSSAVAVEFVGPTWGGQITNAAVKALIAFFIGIVLYISIRFEWKMAAAALIAVIHDLLVTVGIYALSGFQVTPSTVIAVLTILGYSLYDTIVVFDRIKENVSGLVDPGKMNYSDAVDLSVNQTLARSLNTSLVAVIPILSVLVLGAYVLGATTLKNFGLALVVGLTSGAYSSLFIASPLLARFKEREHRYRQIRARLERRSATADHEGFVAS
ncbi:MAG: protein translocase subunit SecF [Ferrimicrobium sp.]|jgi:preprotein translocase subunit SecF|uniref:Protein-export membrane protein SecF n=1 Tax=Ferrimicrobium acidiphilum TaxID=121039 RepID=A0ABV3Y6B8_9ACTN|nr:protein translocase subunit SecF [Ferrimicrobium sp.]